MPDSLRPLLAGAAERLPAPDQPLQVRGRAGTGELQQLGLIVGRGRACERPDLRVRDFSPGHRVRDERKAFERPCGPDLLVRRVPRDADPPRQPLGTRAEVLFRPVAMAVRLRERPQELASRGRDLTVEHRDTIHAVLARVGLESGPIHRLHRFRGFHRFHCSHCLHHPSHPHWLQRVRSQYNRVILEALGGRQTEKGGLVDLQTRPRVATRFHAQRPASGAKHEPRPGPPPEPVPRSVNG